MKGRSLPAKTSLKTSCIVGHFDELNRIEEEWNEIYDHHPTPSLFLSFDYMKNWYRCFARPDQVHLYRIAAGEVALGFLPLRRQTTKAFKILTGLTNNHCFHEVNLVRKGAENFFHALLLQELHHTRQSWDCIKYSFNYSFSTLTDLFPEEDLTHSGIGYKRHTMPTFSTLLNKPFADFIKTDLSRKIRHNINNYNRKINQEGTVHYLCYEGQEARAHFSDFVALEDSGWKGTAGSSIKRCGAPYQRYYETLIKLLANQRALRLFFLEYNGQRIAGLFGYTDLDTFHSFKIAYNEQFSSFSPATLLLINTIKFLTETAPTIKRFHMFPWDSGYKHRFVNEDATSLETMLFSPSWRGQALQQLFTFKKWLRKFLKARRR